MQQPAAGEADGKGDAKTERAQAHADTIRIDTIYLQWKRPRRWSVGTVHLADSDEERPQKAWRRVLHLQLTR
jgi:hypothetical protein